MLNQNKIIQITLTAIILSFIFCPSGQAQSKKVSMATYFPAPQGIFDRITFVPQTMDLTAPCSIGTIQADLITSKLAYCKDDGTGTNTGMWGAFSSIWTQTKNNEVYPASSVGNLNINLGIGTNTPKTRLHIENDGGILALGTFGSGQIISDGGSSLQGIPTVYRFIWYPRRAIFRSMGLTTKPDATNDSSMATNSIAFGLDNTVSRTAPDSSIKVGSIIASGNNNTLNGNYSVLAGGVDRTVTGDYAVALVNEVSNRPAYNTFTGNYATIAANWGSVFDDYTTIGSGFCNDVGVPPRLDGQKGIGATIIGANNTNTCNDDGNYIPAPYSTIGGGHNVHNLAAFSTIGGGRNSWTGSQSGPGFGSYATLGGGRDNVNSADHGTLTGGYSNEVRGAYGTVAGGSHNLEEGDWSVISGGSNNHTSNSYDTILGGQLNTISGQSSVIAGGKSNTVTGNFSVASGTLNSTSGDYSWVGGKNMKLVQDPNNSLIFPHRSFVWGNSDSPISLSQPDSFIIETGKVYLGRVNLDSILNITRPPGGSEDYLAITSTSAANAGNIFVVKANGFIGIGNNNPQYPLQIGNIVNGSGNSVGILTPTGNWTTPSSRKYKENIVPLDPHIAVKTALQLDPVTYNYKINKNNHYVGYIAEDVPDLVAAKGRRSVDPMNITAVLTAVVKDQKRQITSREKVLDNIEMRLNELESRLASPQSRKR